MISTLSISVAYNTDANFLIQVKDIFYDFLIIRSDQIRKLLEKFLKPKEATRIHRRRYWLCRLPEANFKESGSIFEIF